MPMTLDEISSLVTSKIGKTDTASIALCKSFTRRRYRMVYDSSLWSESLMVLSLSITSGTQEIIVPHIMERVISARWDQDLRVWPVDLSFLIEQDPTIFERTGDPTRYSKMASSAVLVSPAGRALSFVSSSSSDTGLNVQIRGEVGNVEYQEVIVLTGTTPAAGSVLWDRILSLGKPTTIGTVTVSNSAGTTLLSLWPNEHTRQHARIWLHATPDKDKTLMLLGKRKIRDLTDDSDAPILSSIDNTLMAYVESDMLEYAKQYGKAQLKQQEGHAQLALMRNLDVEQQGRICQVTPVSSGEYERSDFVNASAGDWMKG